MPNPITGYVRVANQHTFYKSDFVKVLPTSCDCDKCSQMCRSPCCGTPSEMQELINQGYASRLMLDDWTPKPDVLKPALKGFEGKQAPWEISTEKGCTFWKDGKCELHDLDLKPIQGKLAHHSNDDEQENKIAEFIRESWDSEEAHQVILNWKEQMRVAL